MTEMTIEKLDLTMSDGVKLRLGISRPEGAACFVVQIVHGFGEHIGQYQEVIAHFNQLGGICVIHDQRGFGEAVQGDKRKQGVLNSYELWCSDILEIRQRYQAEFQGLPWVLFGHSLGGNIALNVLLKHDASLYRKAIIESPWLALAKELPPGVNWLAKILGQLSPKLSLKAPLRVEEVVHDQARVKAIKQDKLFHTRLSFRLYAEIVEAGDYALSQAKALALDTLLLGAEDERIVSRRAIRQFAQNSNSHLTYQEFPQAYHMLHLDDCQAEFYARIDQFLNFDSK